MKKGNFDEALMSLLRMLKDSADKGNRDCREALRKWDSVRGADWYCKGGR